MSRAVGLLLGLVAVALPRGSPAQVVVPTVDSTYRCVVCHAEHRRAFVSGVHAERGVQCHVCHGGDPAALALPAAHRGRFLGRPSKRQVATLCASCHADPDRMRQYGLPSDQLAALRTSRHGQLLERGNADAPTCTDCHETHTILRATDARSNSHPFNVPRLCAQCHADATLMGKYGLPTEQFSEYAASAHGMALFRRENLAAPTCIGCHGSHSALPPGVTEVTDVCGRCHALERDALEHGPHGRVAARGALPGCLGCHSNHRTETVPNDSLADRCLGCHTVGSRPDSLGAVLEARIVKATEEVAAAEEAMTILVRAGRNLVDAQLRYEDARTWHRQMGLAQHSLDLEGLEDLSLRVTTATRAITHAAEVATEQRWEHRLLLIPVWFLALAIAALAWFWMHDRSAEEEFDGG